jgi:hypothetical protein
MTKDVLLAEGFFATDTKRFALWRGASAPFGSRL